MNTKEVILEMTRRIFPRKFRKSMHKDDKLRGRGANLRTGLITPANSSFEKQTNPSVASDCRDGQLDPVNGAYEQQQGRNAMVAQSSGYWESKDGSWILIPQAEFNQRWKAYADRKKDKRKQNAFPELSGRQPTVNTSCSFTNTQQSFMIPRKPVGSGESTPISCGEDVLPIDGIQTSQMQRWINSTRPGTQETSSSDDTQQDLPPMIKVSYTYRKNKAECRSEWIAPRRLLRSISITAEPNASRDRLTLHPPSGNPITKRHSRIIGEPRGLHAADPEIKQSPSSSLAESSVVSSGANGISITSTLTGQELKELGKRPLTPENADTNQNSWQRVQIYYIPLGRLYNCPWIRDQVLGIGAFLLHMIRHVARTLGGQSTLEESKEELGFFKRNSIRDLGLTAVYLVFLWLLFRVFFKITSGIVVAGKVLIDIIYWMDSVSHWF